MDDIDELIAARPPWRDRWRALSRGERRAIRRSYSLFGSQVFEGREMLAIAAGYGRRGLRYFALTSSISAIVILGGIATGRWPRGNFVVAFALVPVNFLRLRSRTRAYAEAVYEWRERPPTPATAATHGSLKDALTEWKLESWGGAAGASLHEGEHSAKDEV